MQISSIMVYCLKMFSELPASYFRFKRKSWNMNKTIWKKGKAILFSKNQQKHLKQHRIWLMNELNFHSTFDDVMISPFPAISNCKMIQLISKKITIHYIKMLIRILVHDIYLTFSFNTENCIRLLWRSRCSNKVILG